MVINVLRGVSLKEIQRPQPIWEGLRKLIPVLQKMIPARELKRPSASAGIRFPAEEKRREKGENSGSRSLFWALSKPVANSTIHAELRRRFSHVRGELCR